MSLLRRPSRPGAAGRPRIAFVITHSETGGAQAHVATLLRALSGRIDAVLLAGGDGPLFDAARALGIDTVRLERLDNSLAPWRAVGALRELVGALRRVRADAVHLHSAKAGALGRLAACWLGIPAIYTVHGFGFKPAAPLPQRLAARVAEWCLAPLTDRLVCVAAAERELARGLPISSARISVIPNGIADTAQLARAAQPLRRIAMVARLARPKRPDLLMQAFAAAGLAECELVIAGDGPQMPALRALAGSLAPARIVLAGNVGDIPALLASSQAFVLASDHEGMPLSVLEAMRAGLPVIASDLPGIREQLDDGRCGLLCPAGDVTALTGALRRLAGDAALRRRLGEAARAHWLGHHGDAAMAEATLAVYRQALPTPGEDAGIAARDPV
ncbi:glycosyltransferase family 4 protein [Cupriavidus sp. AU9028]|uniref:glycosyltransferase family 4 protein n=1 Tax=Cupriavidus sp. AU9028 TaxID=2871157 RepID=UPI001C97C457|nr:glycosyltransferase family 4 protein [Cupriavidus sp. AU9028]MBY4898132.1 glycosyltransferase family 4 protein [Cupriavidus sp. AU9028]